jgi:hypothetical protein
MTGTESGTDTDHAARGMSRVAFITCADLPDLDPDDRLAIPELRRHGCVVHPVAWDDPAVDWSAFDLAVLRSPWDYPPRRDEFVAWARGVPRLANPAPVVAWNTDKRYLGDLTGVGVPVVPTTWVDLDEQWEPPRRGEWVLKPAVGAGSRYVGRYRLDDPDHRRLAAEHLARLRAMRRVAMIQPYLAAVDRQGETGLVFLADPGGGGLAFHHAIRKGPMLTRPEADVAGLYGAEDISPRTATATEVAVAEKALAAVPGGTDTLLYARVDLIPGPDGSPLLVELELTEPSLFLASHPDGPAAFAAAIAPMIASIKELFRAESGNSGRVFS